MKILSPAISRLARLRQGKIDQWMNEPIAAQREVLQDLITHGQYTEFGRRYGMKEIFNIRKFKEAIPIHEYEDLKPYINRLMEG
ncbi:MAG: GH3 auxin-responsive promoter family protein, partial [Sediminibacterium sp.]